MVTREELAKAIADVVYVQNGYFREGANAVAARIFKLFDDFNNGRQLSLELGEPEDAS